MKKLSDIPKEEWERIYRVMPIDEIATAMRVCRTTIEKTLKNKGIFASKMLSQREYKSKNKMRTERY
jgi:hypothetical protein